MANRALIAKAERAQRQRREAGAAEFGKACYMTWRDVGGRDADAALISAALNGGMVKRCEPGRYMAPEGKGGRRAWKLTYGDGTRRWG